MFFNSKNKFFRNFQISNIEEFLFGNNSNFYNKQKVDFKNSLLIFLFFFVITFLYRVIIFDVSAADTGTVIHYKDKFNLLTSWLINDYSSLSLYRPLNNLIEGLVSGLFFIYKDKMNYVWLVVFSMQISLLCVIINNILKLIYDNKKLSFLTVLFLFSGKVFISSNLINTFTLQQSLIQICGFALIHQYLIVRKNQGNYKNYFFILLMLSLPIYIREVFIIFPALLVISEIIFSLKKIKLCLLSMLIIGLIHCFYPLFLPHFIFKGEVFLTNFKDLEVMAVKDVSLTVFNNLNLLKGLTWQRSGEILNSFGPIMISFCIFLLIKENFKITIIKNYFMFFIIFMFYLFLLSSGFQSSKLEFWFVDLLFFRIGVFLLSIIILILCLKLYGAFWSVMYLGALFPLLFFDHSHSTHNSYPYLPFSILLGLILGKHIVEIRKIQNFSILIISVIIFDQASNLIISGYNNYNLFKAHRDLAYWLKNNVEERDVVFFNFNTSYNIYIKSGKVLYEPHYKGYSNIKNARHGINKEKFNFDEHINELRQVSKVKGKVYYLQLISENTEHPPNDLIVKNYIPEFPINVRFKKSVRLIRFGFDPFRTLADPRLYKNETIEDTVELWSHLSHGSTFNKDEWISNFVIYELNLKEQNLYKEILSKKIDFNVKELL